ncbi:plasmid partitioning protein RepB C-terminal domain-containing protein [Lysobacter soli]|uniref:plasmid partitioning protein RepB C-terminal domain-containing protein n=1 Tax=Lysobacter soli TaxID=453783 RepID=UPI0018DD18A7|nr:plasmid partitioning protein RepB C-terminal domain-containing protein [Lysobacter soli]
MNNARDPAGSASFEKKTRTVAIDAIIRHKAYRPTFKQSQKYKQIVASIQAVGLVELPVVIPDRKNPDNYYLLDGQMRLEALKDLGATEVECLVSMDDEAYTYNKRINRLSVVQEHRMIVMAVERGAPEEEIAVALNLSANTIRSRFRLLDGLCAEAVALLSDKPNCTMTVINVLKRMKPLRQMQAAELIVGQNNYSSSFAKSILAATSDDQLVESGTPKGKPDGSRDQLARLERELEATQRRTRFVEETFGDDNLCLTVAQSYLANMLSKPRVVQWLAQHHADYLNEFQALVSSSLLLPTQPSDAGRTHTRRQ